MRTAVEARKIIAGGLCTDIRIKPTEDTSPVDAIKVHLEHQSGECVDVFLPYEKTSTNEFLYGNLFVTKAQTHLFWRA
jgi:hypothetical protein